MTTDPKHTVDDTGGDTPAVESGAPRHRADVTEAQSDRTPAVDRQVGVPTLASIPTTPRR
jgi:hypothetical protein